MKKGEKRKCKGVYLGYSNSLGIERGVFPFEIVCRVQLRLFSKRVDR